MEINGKICTSLFIENFNKIIVKIHVLWKLFKQQIRFVIFNIRICSLSTKYLHIYFYSKNVCLQMSATFPKLPLLVVPKSPSTWIIKQNSTKIQNSNPQLSNGLFLSIMFCKPQKLCNLPIPLKSSPWGCIWCSFLLYHYNKRCHCMPSDFTGFWVNSLVVMNEN